MTLHRARPSQGDVLLSRKREKARAARQKQQQPPPLRCLPSGMSLADAGQRYTPEELENKREVERCLRAVYDEACQWEWEQQVQAGDAASASTPPALSYETYTRLLADLRVLDGVARAEEVLKKTRPPPGCRVNWHDFNICLKIIALNKFPEEEAEEAADRVVVDAVGVWMEHAMSRPTGSTPRASGAPPASHAGAGGGGEPLPDHVNGIGDISIPLLPEEAVELQRRRQPLVTIPMHDTTPPQPSRVQRRVGARQTRSASGASAGEGNGASSPDLECETRWVPEEMRLLLRTFVAEEGADAWGVQPWAAFMRRLLGEHAARLGEPDLPEAWERHCVGRPPLDLQAFCNAFSSVAEAMFTYSPPDVAQQLALQISLNTLDVPMGFAG